MDHASGRANLRELCTCDPAEDHVRIDVYSAGLNSDAVYTCLKCGARVEIHRVKTRLSTTA